MSDFVKAGQPIQAAWANRVVTDIRQLNNNRPINKTIYINKGGSGNNNCAFGSITSSVSGSSAVYIQGGIVFAGDKNFNVSPFELDVDTDTSETGDLYYFEIPCEANRDDDNELILGGIKTSTWDKSWVHESVEEYPDNTPPILPSGIGTIIIPLGKIIITEGIPTFSPTGCGNIRIDQCGGTLTFSRE